MDAFDKYLNNLFNNHKKQFAEYGKINWINTFQAEKAERKRSRLLEPVGTDMLYNETKPFYKRISKGCTLCGQGQWSCLFITGKCNAGCFYCPASQVNDEVPATQSFTFDTPEAYAEYINHFGFKGVSFSGGEPLLFFDRTLSYLEQIRKNCSPELYIWMYTNGILADEAKQKKLADVGLNEIRFDIGATGYRLDKVKLAKGIIPNITIEIPAVPEEKVRLKKMIPQMIDAGVSNLNLHQLRLTKHNAPKLLKHHYTYIPAEQPIVLESELAALEILEYVKSNNLDIGINYCSFYFKNRFQKAGFRKKIAGLIYPGEEKNITEKGFIREYDTNNIGYKAITLTENLADLKNGQVLHLKHKSYGIKNETALASQPVDEENKNEIENLLKAEPEQVPSDQQLFDIWNMEYIEKGLRKY